MSRQSLQPRRSAFVAHISSLVLAVSITSSAHSQTFPTNFANSVVVGSLDQPTSMAFLPDGRVLVTEQRSGKVRVIVNGHIAATDPAVTVPNLVNSGNEQGLLAMAVDPAWPNRPYVYLYHDRTGNRLRLVRYQATGDLSNPSGENLQLTSPYLIIDDIPDNASNHNGGSLRFGPDGKLYLSMGEDADQCSAQDSTTLKGEILRLDVSSLPAGAGGPAARITITPSDNPLITTDANAKLVFAYGLRNPFRFHIDPATGYLYVGDVGEGTWEEYSEVRAAYNLGWPFREANAVRSSGSCTEPVGTGSYEGPIASYNHTQGTAIMGGPVYRPPPAGGAIWPAQYWGDAFYAEYYTGFLRRIKKTGSTWAPAPAPGQPNSDDWATGLDSPVEFMVGPDGSLYWLSQFDQTFGASTGKLNKIRWTGTPVDVTPSAALPTSLTATPSPFRTGTELSFTLAVPAEVRLSIYDISGREVRRLMAGHAGAGPTHVRWDGADATGRSVPAGVYLARLERAGRGEVVRILRLH